MKDERRHRYRIDPAKVQQKIYEIYPANSIIRKQMFSDAKQKELERLNTTISSFPFELSEVLLVSALSRCRNNAIFSILWLVGFGGLIFCAQAYATTILEQILLGGLGGFCFFRMCRTLITSFRELMAAHKLSKTITAMIDRISDLKKKAEQK